MLLGLKMLPVLPGYLRNDSVRAPLPTWKASPGETQGERSRMEGKLSMPSCERSVPQAPDLPGYCVITKFKKMIQSKMLTVTTILVVLPRILTSNFFKIKYK